MTVNPKMYKCVTKDELYHYGVLGMKWGVRRYQPYSSKPRSSGKTGKEFGLAKKASARISKSKANKKRIKQEKKQINNRINSINKAQKNRAINTDINKMTDNELRQLNNRIREEEFYKKSIKYKKSSSAAKNYVAKKMSKLGDDAVNRLIGATVGIATAAVIHAGKSYVKKKFGG